MAKKPAVTTTENAPAPKVEDVCLAYTILERDGDKINVEFKNPDYKGMLVREEYEEEVDGEIVSKVRFVDKDPNPHVRKSIRVPLLEDGSVDRIALKDVLIAQARGVKNRMIVTPIPVDKDLDDLVGATL